MLIGQSQQKRSLSIFKEPLISPASALDSGGVSIIWGSFWGLQADRFMRRSRESRRGMRFFIDGVPFCVVPAWYCGALSVVGVAGHCNLFCVRAKKGKVFYSLRFAKVPHQLHGDLLP